MLRIRPWPFKDEITSLHWIGNVKMKSTHQWYIDVAFKTKNKIQIIELPIGLLPTLRVGQYYQEGLPFTTQKEGTYGEAKVTNLQNGKVSNAIDICRKFNYFLFKEPTLMNQKIWSFQAEQITYHISHVELIRALFAKNKTLSNALVRPNGLDFMISKASTFGNNSVAIDFNHQLPSTVISSKFVQYFSWLYLNKEIKQSFASVQSNLYANATKTSSYLMLEVAIPPLRNINIAFRGLINQQDVLILELIGIDNMTIPVSQIEYSHPSIKRRLYTNAPKKHRLTQGNNKEDLHELNEKEQDRSKEETNQIVDEIDPIQLGFKDPIVIRAVKKFNQKVNQGDIYISNKGSGGGTKRGKVVGVDEPVYGGNIKPLEFQSLEIAKEISGYGLDGFIKMIKYLSKNNPQLSVALNIVYLPLGRKFSFLPDGRRRVCAIAKVSSFRKMSYIIEVAVPDDKSISTLVIPAKGGYQRDEGRIKELLLNLVFFGGSWSKSFMESIPHMKVRHLREVPSKWSRRMMKFID
ncbi:Tn7-like element transposition protein TnsE [Alkalihalobacillus oceani]|uniref:Tn7-like element transposition protein TnsE n=1 Tax=Halalkalibacter oceani TaxID=1653776 RepID=A0A9X2IPB1_9BACI|nr:Tn7-like element transposition protein TnsE [Halalkalibacter oceani]MCM3715864.1 Tn7-like element transposition protein TnsE [Halalkalibacter oceani]